MTICKFNYLLNYLLLLFFNGFFTVFGASVVRGGRYAIIFRIASDSLSPVEETKVRISDFGRNVCRFAGSYRGNRWLQSVSGCIVSSQSQVKINQIYSLGQSMMRINETKGIMVDYKDIHMGDSYENANLSSQDLC